MIFRYLPLLYNDPVLGLLVMATMLGGLILAITIHEFSHALVADRLGDRTARDLGRLSLNPLVHLDPLGSLMLLLVGFGWGKPVPVNQSSLTGNQIRKMAAISFAGPLSNILMASLLALPLRFGLFDSVSLTISGLESIPLSAYHTLALIEGVAGLLILINLILAVFNLLPLAPLDGSKVAQGLLPKKIAEPLTRLDPWGPAILLSIIAFDWLSGDGVMLRILSPFINILSVLILGHSIV